MIYFIGGASRTGKTTFAEKIAKQKQINFTPLDPIRDSLNGKPNNEEEIPAWFYPKLEELVKEKSDAGLDHIFEGDCFYPEQIIKLAKIASVRACFLGSLTIDTEYLSKISGWHLCPGIDLNVVATKVKNRSKIFKNKSLESNFQYIDVFCHENDKTKEILGALLGAVLGRRILPKQKTIRIFCSAKYEIRRRQKATAEAAKKHLKY